MVCWLVIETDSTRISFNLHINHIASQATFDVLYNEKSMNVESKKTRQHWKTLEINNRVQPHSEHQLIFSSSYNICRTI